ncbi:hypothetical protein T06_4859 [Trichinella sp. T6]|nr:hypothetical protein T06_4859 [Trichinella sp. T6]
MYNQIYDDSIRASVMLFVFCIMKFISLTTEVSNSPVMLVTLA